MPLCHPAQAEGMVTPSMISAARSRERALAMFQDLGLDFGVRVVQTMQYQVRSFVCLALSPASYT